MSSPFSGSLNRSGKAIPATRYGLNQIFTLAKILERLSQQVNVTGKIALFDKVIGPHFFEQFGFGDHLAALFS